MDSAGHCEVHEDRSLHTRDPREARLGYRSLDGEAGGGTAANRAGIERGTFRPSRASARNRSANAAASVAPAAPAAPAGARRNAAAERRDEVKKQDRHHEATLDHALENEDGTENEHLMMLVHDARRARINALDSLAKRNIAPLTNEERKTYAATGTLPARRAPGASVASGAQAARRDGARGAGTSDVRGASTGGLTAPAVQKRPRASSSVKAEAGAAPRPPPLPSGEGAPPPPPSSDKPSSSRKAKEEPLTGNFVWEPDEDEDDQPPKPATHPATVPLHCLENFQGRGALPSIDDDAHHLKVAPDQHPQPDGSAAFLLHLPAFVADALHAQRETTPPTPPISNKVFTT